MFMKYKVIKSHQNTKDLFEVNSHTLSRWVHIPETIQHQLNITADLQPEIAILNYGQDIIVKYLTNSVYIIAYFINLF